MPQLKKAAPGARIVNLSSMAHEPGRMNLEDMNGCMRCIWKCFAPFIKTPESGANTSIYCAVEESIADHNGRYYSDCREKRPKPQAENMEDAKKLWEMSEE